MLLPLPSQDYAACVSYPVKPNGYSQVELDTNRYSVPVTARDSQLVLQAGILGANGQVYVLDMGVVLAVHRADHPAHDLVRPWFDDLLDGTDQFAVPRPVWASFLRHATDPAIFVEPTPAAAAFDFIDAVCAQPQFLPVEAGPRHLRLLRSLCVDAAALSMDAYQFDAAA